MSGDSLEPNFSALVLSLGASAAIGLGIEPDPSSGALEKNPELAKFNIDMLVILRDKTKGNLVSAEADLLERLITDLQIKFIQTKS